MGNTVISSVFLMSSSSSFETRFSERKGYIARDLVGFILQTLRESFFLKYPKPQTHVEPENMGDHRHNKYKSEHILNHD